MSQDEYTEMDTQQIPVKKIAVKPGFNPRDDAEPSDDFIASVKEVGFQEDLHLWPVPSSEQKKGGPEFYIMDGERRFRTAKKLKFDSVPAKVHSETTDEFSALITALVIDKRKNLTDDEKGRAFRRILDSTDDNVKEQVEATMAKAMGLSVRSLREISTIDEKATPALKKAAAAKEPSERVPRRAAARAAQLPEKEQKELLPQLKGKSEKEATAVVRAQEKKAGAKRPGRKPAPTSLRRDAARCLTTLEHLVVSRLEASHADQRALAHYEALMVLSGEAEVYDLYTGDGKAPTRIATPQKVRQAIDRHKAARAEADAASQAKAAKKKVAKKVAVKKKAATKKRVSKSQLQASKKKAAGKKTATKKKTTAKKPPAQALKKGPAARASARKRTAKAA